MARAVVFLDGQRVVSGWHRDGKFRIWGWNEGRLEPLARIPGQGAPACALALSAGGVLASATATPAVQLWTDAGVGLEELQLLPAQSGAPVVSLAFSRDGRMLVCGTRDGRLECWKQGELGFEHVSVMDAHRGAVAALAFHPDGVRLFSGGEDWLIKVWSLEDGALATPVGQMKGHSAPVSGLSFNPRSWLLASSGAESRIRIWSGEGDVPVEVTTMEGGAAVLDAAWSPSGTLLAGAAGDGQVKVWQQGNGLFNPLGLPGTHGVPAISVAFAPDSTALVSLGEDGQLKCWRVRGG